MSNWNFSYQETYWKPGQVADPNGANAIYLGPADQNRYNYLPTPNKEFDIFNYTPILWGFVVVMLILMLK